jgi:hypothetical protein
LEIFVLFSENFGQFLALDSTVASALHCTSAAKIMLNINGSKTMVTPFLKNSKNNEFFVEPIWCHFEI